MPYAPNQGEAWVLVSREFTRVVVQLAVRRRRGGRASALLERDVELCMGEVREDVREGGQRGRGMSAAQTARRYTRGDKGPAKI